MLLTTNAVEGKAQLFLLPYPVVQAETLLCCWEDLKMSKYSNVADPKT